MNASDIKFIVVHYSATYEDQDFTVKDIRRMHLARNFNDVGYHYVIRRDGVVEKGRSETTQGAHTLGYNGQSIGICGIGGINRVTGPKKGVNNWTDVQEAAILKLIDELKVKYPNARVVGHRDLTKDSKGRITTECPGFDVEPWYRQHLVKKVDEKTQEQIDSGVLTAAMVRQIIREELAAFKRDSE